MIPNHNQNSNLYMEVATPRDTPEPTIVQPDNTNSTDGILVNSSNNICRLSENN